jgi:uncharacterized protein YdaU (DUF1376 family)
MLTKLTLSISEDVIKRAKSVARKRKTSISKMVERFLSNTSIELENKSITETILANAPASKTPLGKEKEILRQKLKAKYAN